MYQEEQPLTKVGQPLNREDFLLAIKAQLHKPFIVGSYSKGVDCFSLVWLALKKVIPDLPRPKNHIFVQSELILDFLDTVTERKLPSQPIAIADIIVIKFPLSYHCCVVTCLNPFKVIHATLQQEKVVETRVPSSWFNQIKAVY